MTLDRHQFVASNCPESPSLPALISGIVAPLRCYQQPNLA